MKIVISLLVIFVLTLLMPESTLAIGNTPNFPSCANPTGNLKVKYETGKHAIIGESTLRDGKDEVYWVEGGIAIQCFCPENGDGIQTNWWNVPGITQSEIDSFKAQGWYFVPTGAAWGLYDEPYLAKNASFSCKGGENGGGNNPVGGIGGGSVLASTGDNFRYAGSLVIGLVLLIGGLMLKKSNA